MNSNLPKITPDEQNVIITIPKSKIKEFIGDVLKTKRRIGKNYRAIYNIQKEDVISIISVIQHRISEQNEADLVDISIDVLFDDGSNREYKSIDQFKLIDDNLKATSVAVIINMVYLIKFINEDVPNKNEIVIIATSSSSKSNLSSNIKGSTLKIIVETNKFTWAEDIINNFTNYINGKFKKPGRIYSTLEKLYIERPLNGFLPLIILPFILVIMMAYIRDVSLLEVARWKDRMSGIGGDTIQSANHKLDIIMAQRIEIGDIFFHPVVAAKYASYSLAVIFLILVLPLVYVLFSNNSFISIGSVSEKKNSEKIQRSNYIKTSAIMGSFISIGLSILANYIYDGIK